MQNVIRFNYFTFKICASQLQFYARRLFGQKENYFVINCAQIIEVTCNVVTEVFCIRGTVTQQISYAVHNLSRNSFPFVQTVFGHKIAIDWHKF
jgi:hypothetical protein